MCVSSLCFPSICPQSARPRVATQKREKVLDYSTTVLLLSSKTSSDSPSMDLPYRSQGSHVLLSVPQFDGGPESARKGAFPEHHEARLLGTCGPNPLRPAASFSFNSVAANLPSEIK